MTDTTGHEDWLEQTPRALAAARHDRFAEQIAALWRSLSDDRRTIEIAASTQSMIAWHQDTADRLRVTT